MSDRRTLKPDSKWNLIRNVVVKKRVFDVNNPRASHRWDNLYQHMKDNTATFFGVQKDGGAEMKNKWNDRLKQLYGKSGMFALKDEGGYGGGRDYEMDRYDEDQVDGRLLPSRDGILKPKQNLFKMTIDSVVGDKTKAPGLKNRSFTLSDINRTRLAERNLPRPIGQSHFFDEASPTSGIVKKLPAKAKPYRVNLPNGMRVRRKRLPDDFDDVDGTARMIEGIDGRIMDGLRDNSRREMGTGGFVGKYLFQFERDHSKVDKNTLEMLSSHRDVLHRPYFTYWVTFVQIVCYIVTVSVYGFAPIGFHQTTYHDEVYSSKMFVESVSYIEQDNLWIGARQADLIHLGAKYSPCMRKDYNVEEAIKADKERENKSSCCIRNDGAGCVQTSQTKCSSILSTWHSNKVCGQDPDYCAAPASKTPFEWSPSIVEWPICLETVNFSSWGGPEHMTCQQAGKPCCLGIQGECRVTTREECVFMRGYFHEEANLCSQISCLDKTCGMLPFWNPDRPDQVYRLWVSLFIHAGLIQLLITILFQFIYMRDVEKLMGWVRVALIYLMSGVVGSLASAIFVPYHVDAGPSGSQFGILSCLFVELFSTWQILLKPVFTLLKLIIVLIVLFIIGLLPMIDNYAHLFGFIYGFLLSFSLMPHVDFSLKDGRTKKIMVFVSLFASFAIFVVLLLLFYVIPIYKCPYCQYFSCIPVTEGFCDSMEVKIRRVVT